MPHEFVIAIAKIDAIVESGCPTVKNGFEMVSVPNMHARRPRCLNCCTAECTAAPSGVASQPEVWNYRIRLGEP